MDQYLPKCNSFRYSPSALPKARNLNQYSDEYEKQSISSNQSGGTSSNNSSDDSSKSNSSSSKVRNNKCYKSAFIQLKDIGDDFKKQDKTEKDKNLQKQQSVMSREYSYKHKSTRVKKLWTMDKNTPSSGLLISQAYQPKYSYFKLIKLLLHVKNFVVNLKNRMECKFYKNLNEKQLTYIKDNSISIPDFQYQRKVDDYSQSIKRSKTFFQDFFQIHKQHHIIIQSTNESKSFYATIKIHMKNIILFFNANFPIVHPANPLRIF